MPRCRDFAYDTVSTVAVQGLYRYLQNEHQLLVAGSEYVWSMASSHFALLTQHR